MNIVEVPLVRTEVEPGWPLVGEDVPAGKRYLVDLDRWEVMAMMNMDTGRTIAVRCIWIVAPEPGGWMPVMAFGLKDVAR